MHLYSRHVLPELCDIFLTCNYAEMCKRRVKILHRWFWKPSNIKIKNAAKYFFLPNLRFKNIYLQIRFTVYIITRDLKSFFSSNHGYVAMQPFSTWAEEGYWLHFCLQNSVWINKSKNISSERICVSGRVE